MEKGGILITVKNLLATLPETTKVVVILSGGMDSTISMRLCAEKYGHDNVYSISFDYGQKQKVELEKAKESTNILGISHKVFNLSALNDISLGFSANVDEGIKMPTIKDILGEPRPITYVPNRNMILMSVAAAYAEKIGAEYIYSGFQATDEYGYHDTTKRFVDKINDVLSENRIIKIKVIAPFANLSKLDEIIILDQLDGSVDLLIHTLTCYNPDFNGNSCGKCPSCSERIANFIKAGIRDPIKYSIEIPWETLCAQ